MNWDRWSRCNSITNCYYQIVKIRPRSIESMCLQEHASFHSESRYGNGACAPICARMLHSRAKQTSALCVAHYARKFKIQFLAICRKFQILEFPLEFHNGNFHRSFEASNGDAYRDGDWIARNSADATRGCLGDFPKLKARDEEGASQIRST